MAVASKSSLHSEDILLPNFFLWKPSAYKL